MEKVRIQDDLYTYVNQEWMDQAIIPEDRPTVGGFADLDKDVEKLMIGEFNSLSESKEYPSVWAFGFVVLATETPIFPFTVNS